MFGLCLFPKREVHLVPLFAHAVQLAAGIVYILQVTSREHAVVVVFVVLHHIEVHRAVRFVGIAIVHDLLDQLFLLNDMPRGMRFDAGRQHVELLHGLVEAIGVVLRHLHRLQLFESCLFGDFILTLVGIVLQMAHVGNVSYVAHLVAQMFEVTENEVESDGRTCMSQMGIAVNGRAANIHPHVSGIDGFEKFLAPCERVIKE